MRYVVYDPNTTNIYYAFVLQDSDIRLTYTGYITQYVTVENSLWQNVVTNPTLYRYDNGEIILNTKGDT